MEISKSTRHSKILGDYGESLVCNWLSRSGFEVSIVDHTGIDILAYNKDLDKRIGISVKSRTRGNDRENSSVNIFSYQKRNNDREKVLAACKAFAAKPWLAIYVETSNDADLYLLSLEHYDKEYRKNNKRAVDDWKMTTKHKNAYEIDPQIKHIKIVFSGNTWQWE